MRTPKQPSREGKTQSPTPNSYERRRLIRIAENQEKFIKLGIAQSKQNLGILFSASKEARTGQWGARQRQLNAGQERRSARLNPPTDNMSASPVSACKAFTLGPDERAWYGDELKTRVEATGFPRRVIATYAAVVMLMHHKKKVQGEEDFVTYMNRGEWELYPFPSN